MAVLVVCKAAPHPTVKAAKEDTDMKCNTFFNLQRLKYVPPKHADMKFKPLLS
jgi:hypothetical protein